MNTHDDDRELREAFSNLRREEQAQATPFPEFLRAATRQRAGYRRVTLAPILAGVALFATLAFIGGHELRSSRPTPRVEVALTTWVEPTAFLLKTPGQEILHSVPAFGRDPLPIDPDRRHSPDAPPSHVK